jgi:hypothetical protein
MCLEVFTVPMVAERVSAQRLSEICGLRVTRRNAPIAGALHFSVDGGCSCSLLSDSASIEAVEWALEPSVLPAIVKALQTLADEAGGFRFQAAWIGDTAITESTTSLAAVLADVGNNRVKNWHVYWVNAATV